MAPLTEREKTQLRLLEAQFQADDPKFVRIMRTKHSLSVWQRPQARRLLLATIGLAIGLVGFISGILIVPIAGVTVATVITTAAAVLVVCILFGFGDDFGSFRKAKTQRFMASLEMKWDERKRNEGFSKS